ncbi:MAG: polyprenyl synthetase family protein [Desulfobacteraceae bacterium]|nr:polyprenyl synthetase family protein [Desulfobacteraceae bacterium]
MNNTTKASDKSFGLRTYLEDRRSRIDARLGQMLACSRAETRVCAAMRHSLMASGKRFRPVLCLAAAEAVGGVSEAVLQTACAIEMIHTYSLIHDDLPAMDNDDLRRGRPTCHVAYDEATAILAGDALLTLAFETLADCGQYAETDAGQMLRVIGMIGRAAGYNRGMIEGQMRDMQAEQTQLGLDSLKEMHRMKTGALIEAAVVSGALLAGADRDQADALQTYAENIGLAFQVTDDILNVRGDPQTMGKASGTDQARGKSTYPALMGLAQADAYADHLVDNALQAIAIFDTKANPLTALARYIIERNK